MTLPPFRPLKLARQLKICVVYCGGGQEGGGGGGGGELGSLRWREAGEKFKKSSFFYLLLLTSSQRNEPNNVSCLPFNVFRGLKQNFIHKKSQKTKIRARDKKKRHYFL